MCRLFLTHFVSKNVEKIKGIKTNSKKKCAVKRSVTMDSTRGQVNKTPTLIRRDEMYQLHDIKIQSPV